MTTLRSHIDQNEESVIAPTAFKTDTNTHEVRCGLCGDSVYVDEGTYDFVREAVESGLDDPFRCESCQEEYDDLAYEG